MTDAIAIKRILVPLDGSDLAEQAIPFAAALAVGGVDLIFVHVASSVEPIRDLIGRVAVQPGEVEDVEVDRWSDALRASAKRWPGLETANIDYVVSIGDYATEILNVAQERECDLIVAASRGRGAVGRLAFGSVVDRLARATSIPILIVRPQDAAAEIGTPTIRRIVVPYDGSELAAGAFPVAIALAKRLSAEVHLIHALNPTAMAPMAVPMEPYYSADVYDQLLTEMETQARIDLENAKALVEAAGLTATYELVNGSPYEVIAERVFAEDIIVMTSHGRSGIRRWLIGSVAEKLVREGPVPVVLVPSAGRGSADNAAENQ